MARRLFQPHRLLWIALALILGAIAYFGPASILAKTYAFFGSMLLAWPFFRTNTLKKHKTSLRKARGQTAEDQELIDTAADRLEQEEAEWSQADTLCMEGGIVTLIVSFFIDLCLSLNFIF